MTGFSDPFTQGGQTQLHKFHMIKQVIGSTLKIALWIALMLFLILVLKDYDFPDLWFVLCYTKAWLRLPLDLLPLGFFDTSYVYGTFVPDEALCFDSRFFMPAQHMVLSLLKKGIQSLAVFIFSFALISCFWMILGKKKQESKILSGYDLVSPKKLKKLIQAKKSSIYHMASVPLPKDAQYQHIMITGTTGSGKTNAICHLIEQIKEQGDQAIIVDTTGGLFARFFDQDNDILLNPCDKRSANWNIWNEVVSDQICDEIASSLIAESQHDSFWSTSSRQVFAQVLRCSLQENKRSYAFLVDLALRMPLKDMSIYFQGTSISSLLDVAIEKTSLSIRANLAVFMKIFEHFHETESGFSFLPFLSKESSKWLFLSCIPEQRELFKPIFSTWISLVIKGLMRRETSKSTWIIIDELASLQKIPSLLLGLAEVRKYGGCFVLGFQDLSQIEEIYGVASSKTLSNLTGTKVLFRSVDTSVAERIAKYLGDHEKKESQESISFGAHQMRDGVNLSDHIRTKPVVRPCEIMMLENLEAYLKVPGNFPISKLKFDYVQKECRVPFFVDRNEN